MSDTIRPEDIISSTLPTKITVTNADPECAMSEIPMSKIIHHQLSKELPDLAIGVGYGDGGGFVAWGENHPNNGGNRYVFTDESSLDEIVNHIKAA